MLNNIPRRSIGEIAARYHLAPELRDIFVEGWLDARVLKWFANEVGATNTSIYEISSVECSADDLIQIGLPDNSRSRVIWLALQLHKEFGLNFPCSICLADSDHEAPTTAKFQCPPLYYTDTTSLEMYFFRPGILDKALNTGAGIQCDINFALNQMPPPLQRLFILRCANMKLDWGMSWYAPWKCLELTPEEIHFNETTFIERYLGKNSRATQRDEFCHAIAAVENNFNGNAFIRGHDAFEVLGWWLKQVGTKPQFCNHEVLLSLAVASVSVDYLLEFALFTRLRDWMLKAP